MAAYPGCSLEQLKPWALIAERHFRRWAQIDTQPDTEGDLRKIIEESEIGRIRGSPNNPVAVIYDPKLAGESVTHPNINYRSRRSVLAQPPGCEHGSPLKQIVVGPRVFKAVDVGPQGF